MLAIAGWSLTACDESFDDWTKSAVYTQEAGVQITGFSATPTAAAASVIDLGTMTDGAEVQLFNFVQGTLPAGVKLENIRLEAKPADQPAATAAKVAATADGKVTKEELAKLVYTFYGKKSTVRTFDASLFANAVKGTEAQLITLGSFALQIKPEKLEDPYYYVYGRATKTSADNAYMFVMTPVEGNESAYTYTTKFTSNSDMLIWNISYWKNDYPNQDFSRVYGTEEQGSKALEGKITQGNNQNYFISPTAAFYTFTIDFEAQTFKWTKLEDQNPTSYTNISLIGVDGDWTTDIDLAVVDRNKHNWYLRHIFAADTELKFRANHAWTTDWGFGDADGAWDAGSEWAKICKNGAKNIKVPKGTYDIYFCDITGAAHFVPVE